MKKIQSKSLTNLHRRKSLGGIGELAAVGTKSVPSSNPASGENTPEAYVINQQITPPIYHVSNSNSYISNCDNNNKQQQTQQQSQYPLPKLEPFNSSNKSGNGGGYITPLGGDIQLPTKQHNTHTTNYQHQNQHTQQQHQQQQHNQHNQHNHHMQQQQQQQSGDHLYIQRTMSGNSNNNNINQSRYYQHMANETLSSFMSPAMVDMTTADMATHILEGTLEKPLNRKQIDALLNDEIQTRKIFNTLTGGEKYMTMQQFTSLVAQIQEKKVLKTLFFSSFFGFWFFLGFCFGICVFVFL